MQAEVNFVIHKLDFYRCPIKHLFPNLRAGDEVRTRDLQLGRLSLYQLSYSRFTTPNKISVVGGAGFEPAKS